MMEKGGGRFYRLHSILLKEHYPEFQFLPPDWTYDWDGKQETGGFVILDTEEGAEQSNFDLFAAAMEYNDGKTKNGTVLRGAVRLKKDLTGRRGCDAFFFRGLGNPSGHKHRGTWDRMAHVFLKPGWTAENVPDRGYSSSDEESDEE